MRGNNDQTLEHGKNWAGFAWNRRYWLRWLVSFVFGHAYQPRLQLSRCFMHMRTSASYIEHWCSARGSTVGVVDRHKKRHICGDPGPCRRFRSGSPRQPGVWLRYSRACFFSSLCSIRWWGHVTIISLIRTVGNDTTVHVCIMPISCKPI